MSFPFRSIQSILDENIQAHADIARECHTGYSDAKIVHAPFMLKNHIIPFVFTLAQAVRDKLHRQVKLYLEVTFIIIIIQSTYYYSDNGILGADGDHLITYLLTLGMITFPIWIGVAVK